MKTTLALAMMGAALISMPAVAQNAAGQGQSGTQQEATASPLYQIKPGQWRASKLDGLNVYNTDNEKIGDINELIVDSSGKIQAVVIGVGGFLGMGEHQVAVPFEQVQWKDQPVERRTSSNDQASGGNGAGGNATAGSGSSTPAGSGSAATNGSAGGAGGSGTTTAGDNAASSSGNRNDTTRMYRPDHAVVAMTKDQLKALPEVRYTR